MFAEKTFSSELSMIFCYSLGFHDFHFPSINFVTLIRVGTNKDNTIISGTN